MLLRRLSNLQEEAYYGDIHFKPTALKLILKIENENQLHFFKMKKYLCSSLGNRYQSCGSFCLWSWFWWKKKDFLLDIVVAENMVLQRVYCAASKPNTLFSGRIPQGEFTHGLPSLWPQRKGETREKILVVTIKLEPYFLCEN